MAKLKNDAITQDDINKYLSSSSDFAFEVQVLRKLITLGFDCEHAGTYEDPITKKTREYDIRARKCLYSGNDLQLNIILSVECKNLRNNFPLIMHCMPRIENEAYVDLIWSSFGPYTSNESICVRLENEDCLYRKFQAAGKSCDQVGRKAHDGEIVGNDGDVFEKISQAINAAYDLVKEAHLPSSEEIFVVTVVIPVLVVPNERIWSVSYKQTGEIEQDPTRVKNIEYYIGKSWSIEHEGSLEQYYLSHLEIVQVDEINNMIEKYTQTPLFNSSKEKELLQRYLKVEK
mgnify:CR=1 FL=1